MHVSRIPWSTHYLYRKLNITDICLKISQHRSSNVLLQTSGTYLRKYVSYKVSVPTPISTTLISNLQGSGSDNSEKKLETVRLNWQPTPRHYKNQLKHIYKSLSKFRLTSMVVITTMGGYAMAPAPFDLIPFLMCTVGTGFISAAANSVNQYHEVPFDSQMSRTKNRILVTGHSTPLHAIGFAAISSTIGLSMLYFGVNGITAGLGLGNLILYTSIYTPLKRISILNTWLGSIVGAIPPLIGWAGCSGTLDPAVWILAGVLYSWQFPHFNALSWNLRPDYSRAGYRMMAVTNPDLCRKTALRHTIIICGLSLMAPALDITNNLFAIEALPLNLYFSYLAYRFYKHSDSGTSRKLFRFSLIHLPALMLLFLINKKQWFFSDTKEKKIMDDIPNYNLPAPL